MFKLLILSRTLWGSWAQKPFCTFLFLDYRKKTSFSLDNLPWVPTGRLKQLLIREGTGCEDKAETVKRNNSEALGQVLVPPQGIHNDIFEKLGFPGGVSGKEPSCQSRRCKTHGFNPQVRKIPWRRAWQPTPVLLPGKAQGQRSLIGYSPQRLKEANKTSNLSCIQILKPPPGGRS